MGCRKQMLKELMMSTKTTQAHFLFLLITYYSLDYYSMVAYWKSQNLIFLLSFMRVFRYDFRGWVNLGLIELVNNEFLQGLIETHTY